MPLPTVLLRHDLGASGHYDWLLADPRTAADPAARLWTARVQHPSSAWASLGSWDLESIAPHRRHYLTYEGPIGAGGEVDGSLEDAQAKRGAADRGSVRRVDEGTFIPRVWDDDRFVIELLFRQFTGLVTAERVSPTLWRARLMDAE
jgi:hypothetical protein